MSILSVDQNILTAVNFCFVGRSSILDAIVRFFAVYLIYLLPIILVVMWFKLKNRRFEIFASFIGAIFAWFVITKSIVPHIWFRARPDLSAIGIKELVFHRPDYSFPSDHATALFALAFGFYIFKFKRAGNWFLLYAIVITFFRVAIGVHFPLDIVAGALSGLIGVALVKLLENPVRKYLFSPIMKLLKLLRIP